MASKAHVEHDGVLFSFLFNYSIIISNIQTFDNYTQMYIVLYINLLLFVYDSMQFGKLDLHLSVV